jgi:superfamily I DNA/RNA helicase
MKNTILGVIVVILLSALLWIGFFGGSEKIFHLSKYEKTIDSLQSRVDIMDQKNYALEDIILTYNQKNAKLVEKTDSLKKVISKLKDSGPVITVVNKYTPHQIDSFFVKRYPKEYGQLTKDTISLPLPVSRATVADVIMYDKCKETISNYDTLISNLQIISTNKDSIISALRSKEVNYKSIISNQDLQKEGYKVIVNGLNQDLQQSSLPSHTQL